MSATDLTKLSVEEVLALSGAVLVELRRRGVCRTENNPTGDYAEYIVAQKLGLDLVPNSKSGYDAVDNGGVRYQIKGRRIVPTNPSTQLGVIRNLQKQDFDYVIGVLFNENYSVLKVAKIPHVAVGELAKFSNHQNGHILHLNPKLLTDRRVEDLTLNFVN
jgi:hypothetical protein